MKITEVDVKTLPDDILERLIFEYGGEPTPPLCQAALVLGTSNPNVDRTPEAVRCYKEGLCKKLVFSGGVYWDTEYGRVTEAEYMRRFALEQGVPDEDIILDELARTTIENMIGGTLAMHRAFDYISEVKDMLLITSLYHMRRSLLIAESVLPRTIRIYPHAAHGIVSREDWRSTELGRRRITAEAGYIKAMAAHGLCPDIELQ
ncbi:MAG: YdcF family protein [Ruminococcaceae bacterium]|nr:YdcF family protein [Oscillospiraceae bacterium]